MYLPMPSSVASALVVSALLDVASYSACQAICALALASILSLVCLWDLDANPLSWPNTCLSMKSRQNLVLGVNNDVPVPPGKGGLCPRGVQLEHLKEDVDKVAIVERAVSATPLIFRANCKPRLFESVFDRVKARW